MRVRSRKSYSSEKKTLSVHEQAYYNKKLFKSNFSLNKKGEIWLWVEQSFSVGG